tara:strand:- start:11799 stop:12032 length:234 start_codon:yes stop_codon:yes gene_type:complete
MKKFMLLALAIGTLGFASCDKDDDGGDDKCTSCTVQNAPAIQICEGENGNAFIAGQDSGVEYAGYVSAIKTSGATCK